MMGETGCNEGHVVDRQALQIALARVLIDSRNFPGKAGIHILGQDMAPLSEMLVDAAVKAVLKGDIIRDAGKPVVDQKKLATVIHEEACGCSDWFSGENEDVQYDRLANAILASGIIRDERELKAEVREECAMIADYAAFKIQKLRPMDAELVMMREAIIKAIREGGQK